MKTFFAVCLTLLLMTSSAFAYDQTKELNLPAADIELLKIDCGAGFLKVSGDEKSRQIKVTAKISVENVKDDKAREIIQDGIELDLEKNGSIALLKSKFANNSFVKSLFSKDSDVQVTINLTITVPKEIDLKINDGSGYIEIHDFSGGIDIVDGSGGMKLDRTSGRLEIEDGSGDIEIEDARGNIRIEDGSGHLKVENGDGGLEIEDGSGNLTIANITGKVTIDDGSGNIDVKEVGDDVFIDDKSGGIEIRQINGNVTLSDGSGSINIDGVEKNVTIKEDGSGGIRIKNVKGQVKGLCD